MNDSKKTKAQLIAELEALRRQVAGLEAGASHAPDSALELDAAAESLRESEERYRRIVETTGEGVWTMDAAHRTTYVNEVMARMLGYAPEEMLGRKVEEFFFPEDLKQHASEMGRRHAGKSGRYERRFRRKDGSEVWTLVSGTPILDAGGAFCGSFGMFADITESRRAIEALRESEERYRRIVETAREGIRFCDASGRILYLNQRMADLLGFAREQMLGRNIEEYVFPEDLEDHRRRMGERRQGKDDAYERKLRRSDGTAVWTLVSSRSLHDAQGRYEGALAMFSDITERKRAEDALRQSEAFTRSIMEKLPLGIAVNSVDPEVEFSFMNDKFPRTYRTTREALERPDGFWEAVYEDAAFREAIRARVLADCASGDPERMSWDDVPITRQGRETSFISARNIPIPDKKLVISTVWDVTERKRAEDALRRSEGKFRHILEQVPLIGISLDTRGRLTFANDHFLKLTGWTREEALGKEWFEAFIPPELCPEIREVFLATMATQDAFDYSSYVNDILARDGRRLTVAWANVLAKDAAGFVTDVTCLGVDLTEQSRTEKLLLQAKDAAEAANRTKGEFLATMSHEIRTPLNGVLGMLQLARTTNLTPEQCEYIDTALLSGQSLLRVLSDILDISRIEVGALDIDNRDFRPADIFDPVFQAFKDEAHARGLDFVYAVDGDMPGTLRGDAGRIRQVAYNLVGNALKYTEAGEVRFEACALPLPGDPGRERLVLAISDTGIGVPQEKLPGIFAPFTQADGSYSRRYGGTGLGLSIVKRLVDLMGGSIEFCSHAGAGTEVHVLLSLETGRPELPPEDRQCPSPGAAAGIALLRVLLVEDDPVNRLTVSHMLTKAGHHVREVKNGAEALASLAANPVDCVLMDIQMPEMDGGEATRRIRAGEAGEPARATPIIALTAHAMKGDREQFLAAGMDGYLAKPVDMDELERVLAQVAARENQRN